MPAVGDLVKRVFIGRALASSRLGETHLPKKIALPVFASDALSSVAYATQEILIVLALAGSMHLHLTWYAAAGVIVVLAVVIAAYRQNVHAYPSGGGDYEVATVNLGPSFGLVVAAALLVDYVLTVAVSASAGIANLGSTPALSFIAGHEATATLTVIADRGAAQPARPAGERHRVRHPELRLHARHPRDDRLRRLPACLGPRRDGRARRSTRSGRRTASRTSVRRGWCCSRRGRSRPGARP